MMKKWIKKTVFSIGIILVVLGLVLVAFIYRVEYGFPFYEETPIAMDIHDGTLKVLVYSKTNGYIHKTAIRAAKLAIDEMARKNKWALVHTKSGGVFNDEQLANFDVVIWNNVTGRSLTDKQRIAFRSYILAGGGFVGLHGAGDRSHHWQWYEKNLIGADFSHHSLQPQMQWATLSLAGGPLTMNDTLLPVELALKDEWYVFYENPDVNGATILYHLDGENINPSGNIPFLVRDKDWGMGAQHPIIWYRTIEKGRSFYSALGHSDNNYRSNSYLRILESGIVWAAKGHKS